MNLKSSDGIRPMAKGDTVCYLFNRGHRTLDSDVGQQESTGGVRSSVICDKRCVETVWFEPFCLCENDVERWEARSWYFGLENYWHG